MQCCPVSMNITSMDLVAAKLFTYFSHVLSQFLNSRMILCYFCIQKMKKTTKKKNNCKYFFFCDRQFLGTKIICPKSLELCQN